MSETISPAIPDDLKARPHWVLWRYETRKGKETKVPYQPNGEKARSNDPRTWSTFDRVVMVSREKRIGYVFSDDDPYIGIDFDDCLDENEELLPWAEPLVRGLDSYTEFSPSRRGVKVWVKGEGRNVVQDGYGDDGKSQIEVYGRGRYFAVTGEQLPGSPSTIEHRQDALDRVYKAIEAKQRKNAKKPDPRRDDRMVIDGCLGWLNPDMDYHSWLRVGMAIHSAGGDFAQFHSWSRGGEKYAGEEDCRAKWDSFHRDGNVTLGTLIKMARDAGASIDPRAKSARSAASASAAADAAQEVEDRATELANAEEVHRLHGRHLRYHVDRGAFFRWTGTHWTADVDGQVTRWAKEVARASATRLAGNVSPKDLDKFQKQVESARGISGVMKLLQTEPGVPATSDKFDRDDYLLNVANGTIDLRTGLLRTHDPDDTITHFLSTPYDPTAACPLFESVVHRAMDGNPDLIAYLQRWAGLCLTGAANVHELLIAYGSGANGKSVIFDTFCGLLESLAGMAPESLLIDRHGQQEHPTELADLLGKRLVIASETESGATLRLQLIKRLTGDTTIKARFMRQDYFEFRRTHKLVLITNNRPRLTENTEAVWRRLRLLPFDVVIPASERDPRLIEKLRAEWPGILAWCVRGCLDWQRNGMNPPREVLVATNEYRAEADELGEFISERCMVGDADVFRVSRADIFAAYTAWAKLSNQRHPLDRPQLYETIRRVEGVRDGEWKANGQKVRGFQGINLAAPDTGGGSWEG